MTIINVNLRAKTMTYEHYFEGRKPSKAQVKKLAVEAIKQGYNKIEISWGENMIELLKAVNGQYYGYGWIKNISGQDLADEIERG
jgi:hypothetical protein